MGVSAGKREGRWGGGISNFSDKEAHKIEKRKNGISVILIFLFLNQLDI